MLSITEAIALGSVAFAPQAGTVVYVDRETRPPGVCQLGTEPVALETQAVLVFRDEQPGANWMHRCAYALVAVKDGAVLVRVASDRPPFFGTFPSSWVVVSDPAAPTPPQEDR